LIEATHARRPCGQHGDHETSVDAIYSVHYMAHKCGFTLKTQTQALQAAGFQAIGG